MLFRFRSTVAVMAAALMFSASPAIGDTYEGNDREHSVPIILDVIVLRPMGLIALGVGATMFGMAAPFIAMTRPQNFNRPLEALVMTPARFVWADPLGEH